MLPIVATLLQSGLTLLGNAVLAKGKDVIEEKLGISLEDSVKTEAGIIQLRQLELDHEEFLLNAVIAQREQELKFQVSQDAAVTERWKADMLSDSWLSKNIRPTALIYVTVAVSLFALASGFEFKIQDEYIDLFGELLKLMFFAYFGGRSLEKIVSMVKGGSK